MIEYMIIIFAAAAVSIIVTIIVLCCCSRCAPRKPEDEDETTEVVLYPENANARHTYEPHHPYFDEPNPEHDRYYAQFQHEQHHQYRRVHLRTGGQPLVTAAVAGSEPTRAEAPYVGTVVSAAGGHGGGNRAAEGVREPVSYGEAMYVSHEDCAVPPAPQRQGQKGEQL